SVTWDKCALGRARGQEADGEPEATFSTGLGLRDLTGHDTARDSRDKGDGKDAGRSAGLGDSGGLPVSAKLACDIDTVVGCAGIVSWHLYPVSAAGFFDQHAVAFRVSAGDRVSSRRCDRGCGSGGALH